MSDLESIYNDALYDQHLYSLIHEEVMDNAALQQCIYLFVEGDTEEVTYPELLAKCDINIKTLGIVIANYNGRGNLIHSLRLLKKTLSHDRPVIITIDNDDEGHKIIDKLKDPDFSTDLITFFPLPKIDPPIQYSNGHRGGSFEEMFPADLYINLAFSDDFMPKNIVAAKNEFLKTFNQTSSWFGQVQKFCAEKEFKKFRDYKVKLGEKLAEECKEPPQDIRILSDKIREIRNNHSIRHPEDIASDSL